MIYYWYYYVLGIILIPGIIFGVWASTRVNTTFQKYDEVPSSNNKPAKDVARLILDSANLKNVNVERCSGRLTDHYDPRNETVYLSENVYDSATISALGVMAHELGHVMQKKDNYFFMKLRNFLIPIINFSSYLIWPLIILGILLEFTTYFYAGKVFIIIGICIYSLSMFITLITIPLERDASRRAKNLLVDTNILSEDEYDGVEKVLSAAGLTYVASFLISLLSMFRFLIFIIGARKRD